MIARRPLNRSAGRAGRARMGALALAVAAPAAAHPVNTYVLGPDDDWCTFIDEAWAGGDLILLEPGDYVGPCTIEGKPPQEDEETTTIQSLDTTNPVRFLHDGVADHVLRFTGEHVALYHVVFEGIPEGVDAIRVEGTGERYWMRFNTFRDVAGTAFRAVSGDGVRLRDSRFEQVSGVPAVFGCADEYCRVGTMMLSGNLFDGASGTVIHRNSWGRVSDNIGADLSGPGILYDGSGGPGTIERNLLAGDDVLVVTSDDVLVRNNVFVGSVHIEGEVDVLGNSILGAITPGTGRFDGNAVQGALPPGGEGNVACDVTCWVDAGGWDFRPAPGGRLIGKGTDLDFDFCGTPRGNPPDSGALEYTEGGQPLSLDLKSHQTCAGAPEYVPGPNWEDEGDYFDDSCRCASTSPAGSWPLALLLVCVYRRRASS